ncbi:MAG: M20/M25/M40 family metallo-hydrolase [Planctomycetota bacterium]|jgi:hypothetical protein
MKNKIALPKLIILLLLSVLVAPATALPAGRDEFPRILPEDFLSHIKYLASDKCEGRETGTKGQKLAAEYIAGKLEEWKIKPAGDDGMYYQKFPYRGARDIEGTPKLTARNGKARRTFKYEKDFTPMTCSADADVKGVPLVFAGYGIEAPDKKYNDYKGINVKGKFAIIMRKTPWPGQRRSNHAYFRTKLEIAKKRGVGGVIFVTNPAAGKDELETLRTNADRARMPFPVFFVTGSGANRLLAKSRQTLEKLESKIADTGKPASMSLKGTTIDAKVKLTEKSVGTENVVAMIEGSSKDYGKEHIIVGAHYDHIGMASRGGKKKEIYHGADDNASGSSALLEVARAISVMKEKPKRTIVFVWFTAEEKGLLGSAHYADNPLYPLEDAVVMVNMDMLGRSNDGHVWIGGAGTGKGLREVVEKLADASGLSANITDSGGGASDHASFYRKNVPSLFFNSGMHKDLHRTTDTVDKINYKDGARIATLALDVVVASANCKKKFEFNKTQSRRDRVFIGLSGMEMVGEGMKITGVVPHSPAEKAGLEKDDIIVSINGTKLKSRRDLMTCLRGKKPGDELKLVVLREGKEEKVSLKLAKR